MNEIAKQFLKQMADEIDMGGANRFHSFYYMDIPKGIIDNLAYYGYIEKKNDVVGSIALTELGYRTAKEQP